MLTNLVTKPGIEETTNEFRYRIRDPGDLVQGSFRRGTIKRDRPRIFGIFGKLKTDPQGSLVLQALRFPKGDGWTRDQVQEWISAHPDIGKAEMGEGEDTVAKSADAMNPTELRAHFLLHRDLPEGTKVTKFYTAVEVKDVDEETNELSAVVNSARIDRDWEIVAPKAVVAAASEFVATHPVLLSSHSYSSLLRQIGEVISVRLRRSDGSTVARNKYYVGEGNQEADWAWNLAAKHGIAAFSIGFIPKKWETADLMDDDVWAQILAGEIPFRTYTEIELLEISQVLIPSNPDAVARAVSKGLITEAQAESIEGSDDIPVVEVEAAEEDLEEIFIEDVESEATAAPSVLPLGAPEEPLRGTSDSVVEVVDDQGQEKRVKPKVVHEIDLSAVKDEEELVISADDDADVPLVIFRGSVSDLIKRMDSKSLIGTIAIKFENPEITFDAAELRAVVDVIEKNQAKFINAIREALAKAKPPIDLPGDSAAFISYKDLLDVMVQTATKVAKVIAQAEVEKARGRVEHYLSR